MRVRSVERIQLAEPVQVYDVQNAVPNHNFLVKTNQGYIASHNCGL